MAAALFVSRRSGFPAQALYAVHARAAAGETAALSAGDLALIGDLWRELGDLTRALPYWSAAAALDPSVVNLRTLAEGALEAQDWPRAEDALERLLDVTPDDSWARFQLGVLRAASSPAGALVYLESAAAEEAYRPAASALRERLLAPNHDPALTAFEVALVLVDHALWPQAELALQGALGGMLSADLLAEANALIGYVREQQGKAGDAFIEAAVSAAPENARVRLWEGLYYRARGDYALSLEALTAAVALAPDAPALYAELGTAHWLTGDFSSARLWLERAVQFSGGDAAYRALLDQVRMSETEALRDLGVEITEQAPDDEAAEAVSP